jgi:alpha-galactosidase
MKERFVLIGAGSAMFTRGLVADLIHTGEEVELALVDIDPVALRVAERLTEKMIALKRARIKVTASTDRREVLPGATVVICTVGVGGRRAWEQDVLIPRKFGLYYPVGDTVGPGGSSRAMRMIPAMVAIAGDVLDLAPQALFFNYSNPMAPVCRAIRKATKANVVGLCSGVFDVAGYLAEALGVPQGSLRYTAVGINHLTWFIEVQVNGQDAMPELHRIAETKISQAPRLDQIPESISIKDAEALGDPYTSSFDHPFSWHLLKVFGAFPSAMDRHVTEFFPQFFRHGFYYGRRLGVDEFSFEGTIADGDRIYLEMQADALSPQPLSENYLERQGGEHEQVLDIIHSIREQRDEIYSVNLPNTGQVPGLPPEAIVEGPAVAGDMGLRAIAIPHISAGIVGTLATRFQWVETIVEAALEGSRDKFIQALILDGAVESPEQAVRLADELLEAQTRYLPWIKAEH